jgi:hypothetical protein
MGGSSSSKKSEYNTTDKRNAAEGTGNVQISGDGVNLHMVPDEAFSLAELSVVEQGNTSAAAIQAVQRANETTSKELGDALYRTLEADRAEDSRLFEQAIQVGIPAAALAFVAAKIWGK